MSATDIESQGQTGLRWGAAVKAVPATVLGVVAVVFAIQNLDSIGVEFFAWSFDLPLVLIMVGSALIGAALWEMSRRLRNRRRT